MFPSLMLQERTVYRFVFEMDLMHLLDFDGMAYDNLKSLTGFNSILFKSHQLVKS